MPSPSRAINRVRNMIGDAAVTVDDNNHHHDNNTIIIKRNDRDNDNTNNNDTSNAHSKLHYSKTNETSNKNNIKRINHLHEDDDKFDTKRNTNTTSDDAIDMNDSLLTHDGERYHVIFSTGCTIGQDWQSYLFFYFAMKSKQPGTITRIASGCTQQEAIDLRQYHKTHIETIMSRNFRLHLTPDYSNIHRQQQPPSFFTSLFKEQQPFKYFNKPFGVRHWMEQELGYHSTNNNTIHDNDIIMLLDPDQILLRPLTNNFTNMRFNSIKKAITRSNQQGKQEIVVKADHGYPVAQQYGYGVDWKKKTFPHLTYIISADELPSPAENKKSQIEHYSVGPPYILTARDMYQVVTKWTEFVPKVYDVYPHLLAEMYAYSLAAAHLNLPHQRVRSFMISNPTMPGEAWDVIHRVPSSDICANVRHQNGRYLPVVEDPQNEYAKLPVLVHYCTRIGLGKWFFSKYKFPNTFVSSCHVPLLKLPPRNLATLYDYGIFHDGAKRKWDNEQQVKRHAYMICTIYKAFNEAARFYKFHHCSNNDNNDNGTTTIANWNETLAFFRDVYNTDITNDAIDIKALYSNERTIILWNQQNVCIAIIIGTTIFSLVMIMITRLQSTASQKNKST